MRWFQPITPAEVGAEAEPGPVLRTPQGAYVTLGVSTGVVLGLLAALAYVESPWALLALLAPAVLVYVAYSRLAKGTIKREKADEAVQKGEERFRSIFDQSNDAIFLCDPLRDRILDINPSACAMLEYPRDELLSTPLSAVHPDEMPKLLAMVRSASDRGSRWTDEVPCVTRTGRELSVEVSASVIDVDEKSCLLLLFRDITDRKLTQERLRETARLASVGELATWVAHELNNLLASILGFSQLLLARERSSPLRDDVSKIYEQARRATIVVQNLLS